MVAITHYTPAEAAARLRRSVHTLANWRPQGKGPPFTKNPGRNGGVLYPIDALERWLFEHTFQSTAEINFAAMGDIYG